MTHVRFRFFASLAVLLALVVLLSPNNFAAAQNGNGNGHNVYIVVLDDSVNAHGWAQHLTDGRGWDVEQVYEHALNGVAVRVPHGQVDQLASEPGVLLVEEDQTWSIQ